MHDARLFQLFVQNMPIVGIACKGSRSDHQGALMSDGYAGFDAEFVWLCRLALANAFNFGCVQSIKLVLVFGALGADALSPLKHSVQTGQ